MGLGAAALALTALAVGIGFFGAREAPASADAKPSNRAQTEEERQTFIGHYGWEVPAEPAQVTEVQIPKTFDEPYESYNQLQKTQGYDLSRYRGKRAKRYSYEITNYPGGEKARLDMLVVSGKIVGGDVHSTEAGGFIHGFALPGS